MMFSTSLIFALFGLSSQWVKPIGTRRKLHKYSVTLGRILNLPPQMRNTPSKLLLCGLFNVKRCKEFGGILRMIAGVGPDGTKYDDQYVPVHQRCICSATLAPTPPHFTTM